MDPELKNTDRGGCMAGSLDFSVGAYKVGGGRETRLSASVRVDPAIGSLSAPSRPHLPTDGKRANPCAMSLFFSPAGGPGGRLHASSSSLDVGPHITPGLRRYLAMKSGP